jgi:periplasmic protein TonB
MAMNLIDRPHFDHDASDHRGLSAAASAGLHAAAFLTLIAAMRMTSEAPVRDEDPVSFMPQHVIFIPHDKAGDGRDQGGERSIDPPRRAHAIGTDPISVPATPPQQPSTDFTIEPPAEASAIPAKPFGDSTQTLAGAINSSGTSLGPGDKGVGTSTGTDTPGFGDGAVPGGPGVTLPVPILRATPKYTIEAMRARVQGIAMVECVVLPDGTVGDARVTRSLDRVFGLDDEAIAAAKRWRFRPGLLNGKPVPVIVTIELAFSVR